MICIFLSHCKSALRSQKSDSSDPVRDPLFLRHQSPLHRDIHDKESVHIKEVCARPKKNRTYYIHYWLCGARALRESASNSVHCSWRHWMSLSNESRRPAVSRIGVKFGINDRFMRQICIARAALEWKKMQPPPPPRREYIFVSLIGRDPSLLCCSRSWNIIRRRRRRTQKNALCEWVIFNCTWSANRGRPSRFSPRECRRGIKLHAPIQRRFTLGVICSALYGADI